MRYFVFWAIAVSFISCSRKEENTPAHSPVSQKILEPTFYIPLNKYFPEFHQSWKTLAQDNNIEFEIPQNDLSPLPLPSTWLKQGGSLLKVYIESTQKTHKHLIALKALENIFSKNEPAPHFRLLLKSDFELNEEIEPGDKNLITFYEIKIDKKSFPLEEAICENIIPWLHTRQILAKTKDTTHKKSSITLRCRVRAFDSPIPEDETLARLQISELALPYTHPKTKEVLFRQPKDLSSKAQLKKLREAFP